jgi:pimeloyl-ACP methyl ester carboxylesterase
MIRQITLRRRQLTAIATAFVLLGTVLSPEQTNTISAAQKETAGKFTEEIVYVQSEDGFTHCGALFAPPKDVAKPIAVIWIHGWGVNFYFPTYVKIGRALAERGYACVTGNTRMHDIGTIAGWRGEKRIRGGGYWGLPSEEMQDLAAWIDFAIARGFKGVVLAGHSAGATAVRAYQADKQDRRVVGIVYASGGIRPAFKPPDPELLAQAKRLLAEGRGDDLLRIPNRPFPAFVSAATYLDLVKMTPELMDFFGVQTPNPAVTRIRCPILAWFGTKEPDIGTAADLELLKSSVKRQKSGPSRVDTVMIQNATHMYYGEEAQVAKLIVQWADTLELPKSGKRDAQDKPSGGRKSGQTR